MRAASVASCQVYQSTPGIIGTGSRVIHGDYSTDVGVAWDAANTTGLIAFRGSQVINYSGFCRVLKLLCKASSLLSETVGCTVVGVIWGTINFTFLTAFTGLQAKSTQS